MRLLSLFALAVPLVSAIEFTSPEANSTLSKGEKYTLTWDAVDTDPSTFSVFLVNFVNWPPSYTGVAFDVETASGQTEVTVPCGVDSSSGFQLNAINGTNVYVIYAQTSEFNIDGGPCEDAPVTSATCAPAATVTVTVSTTLSKSLYGNYSTTAAPSAIYTPLPSPGKCPDTIGWGESGYSYPVKLTSVPHADYDVATATYVAPPKTTEAPYPVKGGKGEYEVTYSTIYQTVYKDLSEVEDGDCWC